MIYTINNNYVYSSIVVYLFCSRFYKPQILQALFEATSQAPSPSALKSGLQIQTLIGLFRDLRGIVAASLSKKQYSLLFDWLFPKYFPPFLTCLQAYAMEPSFTTPFLKFLAEFVYNKSTRLAFECSSPNGILLFREMSKVIVTYGRAVLEQGNVSVSDVYHERYKGVWICMVIMQRCLGGNYINFGVFELY